VRHQKGELKEEELKEEELKEEDVLLEGWEVRSVSICTFVPVKHVN
jgi:hypothetical protein